MVETNSLVWQMCISLNGLSLLKSSPQLHAWLFYGTIRVSQTLNQAVHRLGWVCHVLSNKQHSRKHQVKFWLVSVNHKVTSATVRVCFSPTGIKMEMSFIVYTWQHELVSEKRWNSLTEIWISSLSAITLNAFEAYFSMEVNLFQMFSKSLLVASKILCCCDATDLIF